MGEGDSQHSALSSEIGSPPCLLGGGGVGSANLYLLSAANDLQLPWPRVHASLILETQETQIQKSFVLLSFPSLWQNTRDKQLVGEDLSRLTVVERSVHGHMTAFL